MANHQKILIGSYTQSIGAMTGEGKGISSVHMNLETGAFDKLALISDEQNPAYLTSQDGRVFAINEFANGKGAGLSVHNIKNHQLSLLDSNPVDGDYPCHVAVNSDQTLAVTSNYGTGDFSVFSLSSDRLEHIHTIQHAGNGPNTDRQEGPHAHFACFLKQTNELVTVDLGTDRVSFYPISNTLINESEVQHVQTPPGSGPRHLVFSQDELKAYVLCELSEEVLVLKKNENDIWEIASTISPFVKHNEGGAAAAIRLSPDEKFVYVSGRQQSSIACLKVEVSGDLTVVQTISSGGLNPRDFNLMPNGKWLVVANQDTNNLVSYRRNEESGELQETGYSISTGNPVCVQFF
ncbi:6-phosphogluconolactonase [Vibrio sp. vnigr-6D03]|uniref:lactonase family protein n=1 Tax=Vibrio sp. vnigr-6D03 TaxID=2058088 RepID=UPI000C3375CB|nr:lactonase family protein [Vibrio sp. vnigr-6D03]PKF80929.1 6-phosphogluconolactonase [Vibrio sp. vnigr-6D03]